MDLKPGFKSTELGLIPNEWDVASLEEISDPKRGIRYGIVQVGRFFPDGVPVLAIKNLNTDYSTNIHRCDPAIEQPYARSRVAPGDVLISVKGTTGRVGLVPDHYRGNISRDIARLGLTKEDCPQYWYQQLQSEAAQRRLNIATVGTTRLELSIGILKQVRMLRPPKEEQGAIAAALSDVDALLGAMDRLITKKRDLKQAAMQQLLTGQTRLPGFSGKWHDTTLGDIGECVIGLTYAPENVVEHGLLVLRSSNVQNNRLAFEDNVYVNLKVPEHLVTRTGDILVCVRNGSRSLIGKCALIDERFAGLSFGAFMSVFRTRHWRFVLHAFQSHGIQRQIRDNIGATINQITNKDMRALRMSLPPEDEQNAIAEVLTDMEAELTALEQRRDKTRLIKQGMMQELLTGRTRLV